MANNVVVKIDKRERTSVEEREVFDSIRLAQREQLKFGDAQFFCDGVLQMVCERKTAQDFVNSVNSGHMRSQLKTLIDFKQRCPAVPVMILIEGDLSTVDLRGVSPRRYQQEIWNWSLLGITRMDTISPQHTVDYYNYIADELEKFGSIHELQTSVVEALQSMVSGKKSQVGPDNFLQVTLMNIPGINKAAEVLAAPYKSVQEFCANYNADKAEHITVGKKKLGPMRARKIAAFIRNDPVVARSPLPKGKPRQRKQPVVASDV